METGCINCRIRSKAANTLSGEELHFLESNCSEAEYRNGEMIISQGKPSTHVAYIKKGLVKIHMQGPRTDQVLKLASGGTYVGIQTILAEKIHQFSATALTSSIICHIDTRSFRELIYRNHEFAHEIIEYLCRDELNYFRRFVNQSQKQVNGRLADTILYLSEEIFHSGTFQLPMSRNELGTLLCTTRESASRAIKELNETNSVYIEADTFIIKDRERLRKFSQIG